LRVNNEYGNGWRISIEDTLGKLGVKTVVESFAGPDRARTPHLLRIKNAGVDALIVAAAPPNQVVAVQQIKQLGLGMKVILSHAGVLPTTVKLYPTEASNRVFG